MEELLRALVRGIVPQRPVFENSSCPTWLSGDRRAALGGLEPRTRSRCPINSQTGARRSNRGCFGSGKPDFRHHFLPWKMTYHDLAVKMGEPEQVALKWPGITVLVGGKTRTDGNGQVTKGWDHDPPAKEKQVLRLS